MQKEAMDGNRMWTALRLTLYIISYFVFWNYKKSNIFKFNPGFQDFMKKIYLSRQKDRIYFISQSVNWILTFKYLDIW